MPLDDYVTEEIKLVVNVAVTLAMTSYQQYQQYDVKACVRDAYAFIKEAREQSDTELINRLQEESKFKKGR